jgi:hypothetical protein
MGTSVAYFYSLGAVIYRVSYPMDAPVQFFETSAMLITCALSRPSTPGPPLSTPLPPTRRPQPLNPGALCSRVCAAHRDAVSFVVPDWIMIQQRALNVPVKREPTRPHP